MFSEFRDLSCPKDFRRTVGQEWVQYKGKGCWPVLAHTCTGDSMDQHLATLAASPQDRVADRLIGKQRSKTHPGPEISVARRRGG